MLIVKKMCLLMVIGLVGLRTSAQVLIYNYTLKGFGAVAGNEAKVQETGTLFYDWQTTNWITVAVNKKSKSFSVLPTTNGVAITIQGTGETFTSFGTLNTPPSSNTVEIVVAVGSPGFGKNAPLQITKSNTVIFPQSLSFASSSMMFGSAVSSSITQITQTAAFSKSATQNANKLGQSINDAVNAMVASLQSSGYTLNSLRSDQKE